MHDRPAFDDWYRRAHPRLVAALAAATGDREVARDAAAEACARALARWDRVGAMVSPGGWVYRTGLNVARRRLRRARMERALLARRNASHPVTPPASEEALEVWDAVRALPDRQRIAVALRYVADLTEPQIADVMGVAPGTVSATLHAARQRLAVVLEDLDEEDAR